MGEVARVRVLCRDPAGCYLLMKWRDPVDGHEFWEPPGGGIEPGETPFEAARRELAEETGISVPREVPWVRVARDYRWAGRHFVHDEAFFIVDVAGTPSQEGFTAEERATFLACRFVAPEEFDRLDAPIEPPGLRELLDTGEN